MNNGEWLHQWRDCISSQGAKWWRKNPTLQRTEQRGISLLVRAIPSSMRETIVAERLMTSTGILFTLLKNYQPGGTW